MLHLPPVLSLFFPMIIIYFGLSLILANASTVAMNQVPDKAHGSAVMNFMNMGTATVVVLSLGCFSMSPTLLPAVYIALCLFMIGIYKWLSVH
jgi:predicted membrane channel-forming protein YqfA (hemolysin III family)